MSSKIPNYETIQNLKSINHISISEIEKCARPGAYSLSGFLGKNEKFKKVLKKDWEKVIALGTTHLELAKNLQNIWDGFVA